ncbi:MAG TPA: hypothetical protein VHG52_12505, partial [Thermomicrobiales bacterium]|nr:hypothetical protein [Thermomicrobiales bacterium]
MAQHYPDVEEEVEARMTDQEARSAALGSGLVVDMDRHSTRAVMFDTVGAHGRFISSAVRHSTLLPPNSDGFQGAREAIQQLEQETGISVLGNNRVETPRVDGAGVDFVALTGQPAEPVKISFLPTGNADLLGTLVAAARRSPTVVELLDRNVRTDDGVLSGTLVESEIRKFAPDAVVVIDGANTQSEWATAIGTLSSLSAEGVIDLVIIVARDQFQQQAAQTMGENADLRGIDPSEFEAADIAAAIETELHSLSEARFDVSDLLPASRHVSFTNRIRAVDLVTTFLARRREQSVTTVSIGDGVTIHSATPDSIVTVSRLDMDAHANVRGVLKADTRQTLGWLPIHVSDEEMHHWVLNRSLRPATVSSSARDRLLEYAIATTAIRTAWTGLIGNQPHLHDVIVGGSALAEWDSPALALLCLLNAFQPDSESGVVEVYLDQDGLMYAAGAMGDLSPALAADVVERDLLMPLASVVVVKTTASEGDLAVRGEITYASGDSQPFSVPAGSVHRLDLENDEAAVLTLNCEPGAAVGSSERGATVVLGEQVR